MVQFFNNIIHRVRSALIRRRHDCYGSKEVGRIKLPKFKHVDNKYLKKIEQLANKKDLKGILRLGDQVILKKYLKLSEDEIIVIKKSMRHLNIGEILLKIFFKS